MLAHSTAEGGAEYVWFYNPTARVLVHSTAGVPVYGTAEGVSGTYFLVIRAHGCPCGFMGHPRKDCHCTPRQVKNYLSKISGPLLDRIDIHIEVPAADYRELRSNVEGESSGSMREQVMCAREVQSRRFKTLKINDNARMRFRRPIKHLL